MKRFILAEKDKQAEAYAKALGSYQERKGVYHLTSSYLPGELHIYAPEGHLFEYMEPEDNWDLAQLPLVDVPFQMTLAKGKKKRFETIYREVQWADEVIIATDADREGERIAYSILSRIPGGKDKITSRLWGQSLSAEGIQANFQALRDPRETYNYYLEAEARAQSDWLVGMNLSPLVTLTLQKQQRLARGKGTSLSVGRVQTALVRVVVENDTRIKNFQPQSYWRLFFDYYGLGTPATRTDIFQKILKRGYVKQDKKTGQLFPERKAYLLIDFMYDNEFSNPETTGDWEDFLKQIGQGQLNPRDFVEAIKDKVKTQVETVKEEGHF